MLRRNGLVKRFIAEKKFEGIFTINDHISDNLIQINIKFTFTVYKYISYNPTYKYYI